MYTEPEKNKCIMWSFAETGLLKLATKIQEDLVIEKMPTTMMDQLKSKLSIKYFNIICDFDMIVCVLYISRDKLLFLFSL